MGDLLTTHNTSLCPTHNPLTHPLQAGWAVDIASPAGGPVPVDAASRSGDFYTPAARRFDDEEATRSALEAAKKVSDCDASAYAAVFIAGGHGAVVDLATDPGVATFLAAADGAGKVVSAVCHGVVALLNGDDCAARFVSGRRLTGFSDAEEAAVGKTDAVGGPGQTLEARLTAGGADYSAGPDWAPHVVVDGRLVTGQNPASSAAVAAAVVEAVEKPPTPAVDAGGA